jgi:cold shock CspA family protein
MVPHQNRFPIRVSRAGPSSHIDVPARTTRSPLLITTIPVLPRTDREQRSSAPTGAKGLTIITDSRPEAALVWRRADDTVWVATADDEYAGVALLEEGAFRVLDGRSLNLGTAPTIAGAQALLRHPTTDRRTLRGGPRRPRPIGRGERSRSSGSHNMKKEKTMAQGTVKWFNSEKGFGFIAPDDGSADVFAHYSEIASTGGFRNLDENQKVEYDVAQGPKGPQAANIRPL